MKNIKQIIKENRRLYAFAQGCMALKDGELANKIWKINNDKDEIVIEHPGTKDQGVICYKISIDDAHAGFFALMRWICTALIFSDNRGFKPYVELGESCKYYEPDWCGENNPFEYYFRPVSEVNKIHVENASNLVVYQSKHLQELTLAKDFQLDLKVIKCFAGIWKKYIRLNDDTIDYLNKTDILHRIQEKKTLGVHIRGTDYRLNYNGHPVVVTVEDEIEVIRDAIEQYGFEQIFVATDEDESLQRIRDIFGDRVLYCDDAFRSVDGTAVHDSTSDREKHHYHLGLEVLRDVYFLSACTGLVAGQSNVSFFAMVINNAENEPYSFCNICNKGFNVNSNVYEKRKV